MTGPFFHGGPSGLRVGDPLLPGAVTGNGWGVRFTGYKPDHVYFTPNPWIARKYSGRHYPNCCVYEVAPEGRVVVDEICHVEDAPSQYRASAARVTAVREDMAWTDDDERAETALKETAARLLYSRFGAATRLVANGLLQVQVALEVIENPELRPPELDLFHPDYLAAWRDWVRAEISALDAKWAAEEEPATEVEPGVPFGEATIEAALAASTAARLKRHGSAHWAQVAANGLTLLDGEPDADPTVVFLFALFHDAMRRSDRYDPDHPARGAQLARDLHGRAFNLDADRLELLVSAIEGHQAATTTDDPTIGVCWDADRLDLPRVGIRRLLPGLFSTEAGRDAALEPPPAIFHPWGCLLDCYAQAARIGGAA